MPDPVLLLHGQPGSAFEWEAVVSALGGRLPALAVDRPGWDGSSPPLDLPGNARAAVDALDAAGAERAIVAGHSLGGAIAAWVAAEYPERVRGLVLAAPSASCGSLNRLDELLATPFLGSTLSTGVFTGIGLTLQLPRARRRIADRLRIPDGYLRRYARTLLNPLTWHSFSVEQRMLVRDLPQLEERLGAISAPTTIVIGTADRIVTPSSARELAGRIPGARLVPLDGATHLLLQERPREVADVIVAAAALDDVSRAAPGEVPGAGVAQDSPGSGSGS
jgi:pimeloyl-ACP methyl ester carboxylesterase